MSKLLRAKTPSGVRIESSNVMSPALSHDMLAVAVVKSITSLAIPANSSSVGSLPSLLLNIVAGGIPHKELMTWIANHRPGDLASPTPTASTTSSTCLIWRLEGLIACVTTKIANVPTGVPDLRCSSTMHSIHPAASFTRGGEVVLHHEHAAAAAAAAAAELQLQLLLMVMMMMMMMMMIQLIL